MSTTNKLSPKNKIDTYDRSKSKDDSMAILLFQWKTVNDVTNTQKHLQSFCTKEAELRQRKGVFKQTHTDHGLQKSEAKLKK